MTTRLNKHIADTGFCSRREADRLIGERRVTVNGHPAGTGAVVGEQDVVLVDGQPLTYGQSITDGCIGWDSSLAVLESLAEAVRARRAARISEAA